MEITKLFLPIKFRQTKNLLPLKRLISNKESTFNKNTTFMDITALKKEKNMVINQNFILGLILVK